MRPNRPFEWRSRNFSAAIFAVKNGGRIGGIHSKLALQHVTSVGYSGSLSASLGASTAYQIVLDQQNVASAESSQVQALANYSHARIGLDQALGRTLEANNITFDEALAGTISRPSQLPATLPADVHP